MNKMLPFTILFLLLTLVGAVNAQDEQPEEGSDGSVWENIVSVNGVPLFGEMNDQGVIHQDVEWMDASLMGQDILDATYHVYSTTEGEVVYVPDAITLTYMAANPEESGYQDASILANGEGLRITSSASLLSGQGQEMFDIINHPNFKTILEQAWSTPGDFFQDLINGKSLAITSFGKSMLNTSLHFLDLSTEDLNLYTTLLVFENCENSPLGCPDQEEELEAEPTPQPTLVPTSIPPRGCPDSQVTTQKIDTAIAIIDPEYPLVIGQDPQNRGADVLVNVTIPPVVYTYYDRIPIIHEVCENNPITNITECKDVIVDWRCEKQVRTYSDPIAVLTANANLIQESISWIENDLSSSWYEAKAQHPNHNLIPGMMLPTTGCDSNHYCYVNQLIERIPFVDPGNYSLMLSLITSGTPVSLPRQTETETIEKIWVTLTTLKEN